IDGYLAAIASAPAKATLTCLRKQLRALLPSATEVISYGMPGFRLPSGDVVAGEGQRGPKPRRTAPARPAAKKTRRANSPGEIAPRGRWASRKPEVCSKLLCGLFLSDRLSRSLIWH